MLGLIVDTNSLTVGIPPDYVAKVFDLLNKHHMAFSPPSFHHRGSTKAYRKIGPSGRGRQLGVPLTDAFIRIDRICLV